MRKALFVMALVLGAGSGAAGQIVMDGRFEDWAQVEGIGDAAGPEDSVDLLEMFFDFFVKQKATKFLKERPLTADAPWGRVANKYGVHMKSYQKNLVVEYIDEYVKKNVEGIYFMDLLKDLADFGIRNTDMAMAFGIALMHDADNANLRIIEADKAQAGKDYFLPTFSMDANGRMSVTNSKNHNSQRDKYDPLGLGVNKGILGNL